MTLQQIIQLLVSLGALYMLVRTSAMREIPKSRYFFPLALAVFFYAFGYLLELDAHSLESAYFSQRIQYLGVSCYAVFYYLFVRDFGGRPVTGRLKIGALFLYPAIVLLFVNLWPDSTLYFRQLTFVEAPSPRLVIARGPLFTPHVLYSFALIFSSAAEVLFHYPRGTRQNTVKRLLFLCATLLPNIAIVIFVAENLPVPMQFGSMSLVLALLILGFYILRFRQQDWLPFARASIVENMTDGYILLDDSGRYMDANAVAKSYFPGLASLSPGTPISQMEGYNPYLQRNNTSVREFALSTSQGEIYLKISSNPVQHMGKTVCICIMVYDVTELHGLVEELEYLATQDALTGLYNRSTFFSLAQRDFDLALRTGQPACVLMLDIDHFKQVNDHYGHQQGDKVLQALGALIKERTRTTDISGRYGGEEFCMFLPATGAEGAIRLAQDICTSAARLAVPCGSGAISFTLSIGLAPVNHTRHKALADTIAEADAALYVAKNTGRNRVCAHGDSGALVAQ